jgi:hypothetical protein
MNVLMLEAIVNDHLLVADMMIIMIEEVLLPLVVGVRELMVERDPLVEDLLEMNIMIAITDVHHQEIMDPPQDDTKWILMMLVDLHLQLVVIWNLTLEMVILMLDLEVLHVTVMVVDMVDMMIVDISRTIIRHTFKSSYVPKDLRSGRLNGKDVHYAWFTGQINLGCSAGRPYQRLV